VIAADFARVFYFDLIVVNCARNGAVYASQDPTCAQDTAGNLTASKVNVTSAVDNSTTPATVTVTVTYPFTTITNYPGVPTNLTLRGPGQMSLAPRPPT